MSEDEYTASQDKISIDESISDITAVENIKSVNGVPYIIANKLPGQDAVAGMTVRQTTIESAAGNILEGKIDVMDLTFITHSFSLYIKGDIDIVSNFKSFSYVMTEKSFEAMRDRLISASENLASAAQALSKISWYDMSDGESSEETIGASDRGISESEPSGSLFEGDDTSSETR